MMDENLSLVIAYPFCDPSGTPFFTINEVVNIWKHGLGKRRTSENPLHQPMNCPIGSAKRTYSHANRAVGTHPAPVIEARLFFDLPFLNTIKNDLIAMGN